MLAIMVASLAGMTLALVLAATAWIERNNARRQQALAESASEDAQRRQAQAEGLLGFIVDDLRPKLEKVRRLDLLDKYRRIVAGFFGAKRQASTKEATVSGHAGSGDACFDWQNAMNTVQSHRQAF